MCGAYLPTDGDLRAFCFHLTTEASHLCRTPASFLAGLSTDDRLAAVGLNLDPYCVR